MAPFNKWWILCVASLSCVASPGSCRRGRDEGVQSERYIFNELCALKDEPGPCKAIKERFFFSVDTGHCERFDYGGCRGNANNFLTLEACEEMCVVTDDKNPCHLPEASGPCRGLVTRYFFDSNSQQCKHFFYGGCFGNANNFRSMAECQAKCLNPAKSTKAPAVHTASVRKLVLQPTIVAEELTASGNQVRTNDTSQEEKELKPSETCLSPADPGTCQGAERRFNFNPNTKRCQMFYYSGCGGNKNNFKRRKDCIFKCIGSRKVRRKMIRIRKKNIHSIVHHSA